MIPDEAQVNSAVQLEVVTASNHSPDQFDFALPNRMLSRELENMKVKQLDLLEPFKQASTRASAFTSPMTLTGTSREISWPQR